MNHFDRLIKYFKETDMISLSIVTNADHGSIWFTNNEEDDKMFCSRFFTRKEDDYSHAETSLVLHGRVGVMHTRIKYDIETNLFSASVMDLSVPNSAVSKDIFIEDASTLDEGTFFQQSTINDYLDLDFSHVSTMIELTNGILQFGMGMINANRSPSTEA